jgi:hypothetical protein
MLLGRPIAADRIGKLLSEQLIPQLPTQKARQLLRNGLRRNTFLSAQSQECGTLQADLQAAMRTNPILIELEVLVCFAQQSFRNCRCSSWSDYDATRGEPVQKSLEISPQPAVGFVNKSVCAFFPRLIEQLVLALTQVR